MNTSDALLVSAHLPLYASIMNALTECATYLAGARIRRNHATVTSRSAGSFFSSIIDKYQKARAAQKSPSAAAAATRHLALFRAPELLRY